MFTYFEDRYDSVPAPFLNDMDEMERTPLLQKDLIAAHNLVKHNQNYQILVLEQGNVALEKEVNMTIIYPIYHIYV